VPTWTGEGYSAFLEGRVYWGLGNFGFEALIVLAKETPAIDKCCGRRKKFFLSESDGARFAEPGETLIFQEGEGWGDHENPQQS